ncbi:MAG: LPP20 family lipoprotein [Spirochaetaceae bacterium]
MGKSLFRFSRYTVCAGLLGVLLAGCASVPECDPKPEWIKNPGQEGYYVGVGSADTGSRAEDRQVAEARAMADLASRISATIRSELEVATSESTAEGVSQEVNENVTQSVEAHLEDIETADTYYCPGEGSWVYVRLNRARWNQIQEQRRVELNKRLEELVEPVISGEDKNFLLQLETLLQGRTLVYESSLGPGVRGTLGGVEGNLKDILGRYINDALSSLSLEVEKDTIELVAGEEAAFSGKVSSSLYKRIGNIGISVVKKGGTLLSTTRTDESGAFSVIIPEGFTAPGEQHAVVTPSFGEYRADGLLSAEALPSKEVVFSIDRVPVGLVVESTVEESGIDFAGQVKSLFSDRDLPIEIIEGQRGEELPLIIRFVIRIEDFPKVMENAPDMAQARAVVAFEREGKTVYSHETKPIKDGGLNPQQAYQRVSDKLFGALSGNSTLFAQLEQAVINR